MIRKVKPEDDAKAITEIYNGYVLHTVVTFDMKPLSVEEMLSRIIGITARYPYFVYEVEQQVVGYCYAHAWKEKAAYAGTLETTVYLHPEYRGRGIGRQLMVELIEACRSGNYSALIACITDGNEASRTLHLNLGFKHVSHFEKVGLKFGRLLDVDDYELII